MSFSAYFYRTSDAVFKTSSHLLPFITEPLTAPATVRHSANMVKAITENVNPGQPIVITADQPVYALRKQLQWIFPDEFRDFVWMLGPLYTEQNFIKEIGDWLEGSGWTKIYKYSSNSTPGKADSFLSCAGVPGIKKSRCAHQVSLAAFATLANEAFQPEFRNYKDWKEDFNGRSATATYWFTVIELEMLLF